MINSRSLKTELAIGNGWQINKEYITK